MDDDTDDASFDVQTWWWEDSLAMKDDEALAIFRTTPFLHIGVKDAGVRS